MIDTDLDGATPAEHRARYQALRDAAEARRAVDTARAQAGVVAPVALDEALVLQRETIPGGWYWSTRVAVGQSLRVIGSGAVSVMLWNAAEPGERLNIGDTVKLQWSAAMTTGRLLFSDMGRVLASITADSCGAHDALTGGSTPQSNLRRFGDASLRNTRDNFRLVAGKLGLSRRDVTNCVTLFAPVHTDGEGRFVWDDTRQPGGTVDLRAELPLLVALSNCPHPLDPASRFTPPAAEAVLWRSPPAGADDRCRNGGVEAERGFDNTAAWLARHPEYAA